MERTLVVIRHAKSSWSNPGQTDFERPLNDRGEHDAPLMGKRLKDLGLIPDLIVSSPAKRARQTAKRIADTIGYEKNEIAFVEELYHCTPEILMKTVSGLDEKYARVFIVAHNPGITEFVNQLSDKFRIDNVPTCGVTGAKFEGDDWSAFGRAAKEVVLFEYPKKFYDSK